MLRNEFDLLPDGDYNSYIQKNLRFDEAKGMFILENSYRSIIYSTGDCVNAFFQKAVVNLVPTQSYKPFFPEVKIRKSGLRVPKAIQTQKYSMEPLVKSNLLLTEEEIKRFLFHTVGQRQRVGGKDSFDYYILDLLGKANTVYDPVSRTINKNSKRTKSDIESIINEFFSDLDINELFLRDTAGTPRKDYQKRWMVLIYDKIYKDKDNYYKGTNKFILEARERIVDLSDPENPKILIQRPETNLDPINFNDDEITAGVEMLKVIQRLLGHETVRLILLQVLDYYGFSGDFKIRVSNRKGIEFLYNMIIENNILLIHQAVIPMYSHVLRKQWFSLFFSKIKMELPIGSNPNNLNNIVEFSYSPVPYDMSSNFEEVVSKYTNKHFIDEFNKYKNERDLLYCLSCVEVRLLLMKKIMDNVKYGFLLDKDGEKIFDENLRKLYLSEISDQIVRQFFPISSPKSLRIRFEDFILSDNEILVLTFKTNDGKYTEIKISKDDLIGKDITAWGNRIRRPDNKAINEIMASFPEYSSWWRLLPSY